jgi:hypothetical protein
MPIGRETRQDVVLPEQIFALLWQAVTPLARFEVDPHDEQRVLLKPRAAALASRSSDEPWTRPGEVFIPMQRRTTRSGEVAQDGIQIVPWTYLEVVEQDTDQAVARIHSGIRRPFGARRQGRVEQIAIAVRNDPVETILRLQSRTAPDKPLVGYEVLAHASAQGQEALEPIGSTDRQGKLAIPPGALPVRMLHIKHGGHLLARLPIVPGAERQIEVPLPDDDARLAAEVQLAALREDLIDVVARRNILMARARQKIKDRNFPAAQKLMTAIDALPGRSQFNLTLTTAARRLRSDDPQTQRRIDQLFEGTQTVLTQYLDVRPINELHDELREAQRKPRKS